jgi:hypothetical protein
MIPEELESEPSKSPIHQGDQRHTRETAAVALVDPGAVCGFGL